MPVPTIETQIQQHKPWTRLSPVSLCTDSELLKHVNEFDYDLSDTDFRIYCKMRGVLQYAVPGSRRWVFFENHQLSVSDYLNDSYFHHAQGGYKYSETELHTNWGVIMLGRAHIQDCWEVFHTAVLNCY